MYYWIYPAENIAMHKQAAVRAYFLSERLLGLFARQSTWQNSLKIIDFFGTHRWHKGEDVQTHFFQTDKFAAARRQYEQEQYRQRSQQHWERSQQYWQRSQQHWQRSQQHWQRSQQHWQRSQQHWQRSQQLQQRSQQQHYHHKQLQQRKRPQS